MPLDNLLRNLQLTTNLIKTVHSIQKPNQHLRHVLFTITRQARETRILGMRRRVAVAELWEVREVRR